MNKSRLLLLFLIIATSCDNPTNKNYDVIKIINISEIFTLKVTSKLLSDFASDFEYIRPEAKPGSYFNMMGISYIGPKFVILWEKTTSQLYAFNRDGKFINTLGQKGSGPDEYFSLPEVYVIPNIEEIHLVDSKRKRILRYGFDFKLIGEIKLNIVPAAMYVYQDKYYICAYYDNELKKNEGNDLIVRDPITFKELKVISKRKDEDFVQSSETNYFKTRWIFAKQDTLFYARMNSNGINIYKILNDKVELAFILINKSTTEDQNRMPLFLNQIMFFNDYLMLGFQRDNQTYTGYFNLKTKKLYNFNIINDFDNGPNFYPMGDCADRGYYSDDLKLQYFLDFWKSKEASNSYNNLLIKFPLREKWLRETIQQSQEDNPWIMIVY